MANRTAKVVTTLVILFICNLVSAQNIKAVGNKIVDESGNEVILRGMGLGGWMLQEGYMLETESFAGPQREIKAKIQSLIGSAYTEEFYNKWHQNHCTRGDIDSLASWGFNSVRLPMHYNLFTLPVEQEPVAGSNTWLEEGFALTDSLLKWCSANHMYVILDLHAAPGGQGRDENISDYDPSKPSLWESEANKQKTIALWRKLADRYANEPWIGGYDLINETNWNFTAGANQNGCSETTNAPLRQLLIDITHAIREVDTRHMVIIEGNCWANNYNGIMPPWDNNLVVSFHKYWSYNDQGSIQGMLNLRNNYGVPLWLGESGENSNQWFTDAIKLMEANHIGWAWWPLKKVGSVVNPLTIPKNSGYQTLLDYWQNGGAQPSQEFAKNALMQLAENAKIENCIFRKDVIDAMFRQVNDPTPKAFSSNHLPGILHCTDFDLGGNWIAYFDTDAYDYHVTTGTYTSWNNGWVFRNDGVDIESASDPDPSSNGYNIGWTADKEWVQYSCEIDSSAAYSIVVRYANAGNTSKIRIQCDNADLGNELSLTSTAGYQSWKDLVLNDVILYKGSHKIRLFIEKGGANLGFMKFQVSKNIGEVEFIPVYAETVGETEQICLTLNKLTDLSSFVSTGFSCTINGTVAEISGITVDLSNSRRILLSLDQKIYDGDIIKLSYTGTQVLSTDLQVLTQFTDLTVKNNLPLHFPIPGKIEAEAFSKNNGLQLETTTDSGGGQNIGYTNAGDYLEYRIWVKKTATYTLDVRAACQSKAGIIDVQQRNDEGVVLNSGRINIPVTGGWQKWTTVEGSIKLQEGTGILRVNIIQPEFNLNWYRFSQIIQDTTPPGIQDFKIYPNPIENKQQLKIDVPDSEGKEKRLQILSMKGELIREKQLNVSLESETVDLGYLAAGCYIVELKTIDATWRSKLLVL
jgi:endoglucanase